MDDRHLSTLLVDVFNATFFDSEATLLCGGAVEPFYQSGAPSIIHFREDFARSALHEVAHWCVAGLSRRALDDYGYWYAPDGRNAAQQAAFYRVEVRPQAIESIFCRRLGIPFNVSVDNLSVAPSDPAIAKFMASVETESVRLLGKGLPRRAALFRNALVSDG